jgi:hypothetical protein
MPSGRDATWEDVLRGPAQAAPQETASAEPKATMTHPAGEVTGIDESTGLPIVRRTEAAATQQGEQQPVKPIYGMSPDELGAAGETEKTKDQQLLTELFGEQGAKRYNALQRTANSALDTNRADAASAEISKMESALSEEQANRLYGIGEQGPTHEDYGDYSRALGNISGDTPQELGQSMKWAVTKMGDIKDPSEMKPDQQQAYAQLRHGFEIADRQGWDKNEVLQAALSGASERFQDPEDAAFMLRQFMKPSGAPRSPESASLPAGQPLKGWDELLQQPQSGEVTQSPRASVSTARQPVALRSQQETPGVYGGESVVKTPTSDLPAKYKLVEAQDLTPSHNAETFAPNPSYPPGVQERAYHTSKEAQARVIQQAQNFDPRYVVNTNPDAVNGPPIVTPDGTVLGGNSRTMSTQRLYERGQGDAYREYLRKNASQFGLNPDAVDKMEKPILVREIPAPSDVEAARRLGSELNKNMTGALGTSERAVSAGRSITPQSLSAVSGMLDDMGSDTSIRDLLRERGRDVLSLLIRDGAITERERPQFIDTSTGGLSEEGKQFAERALLGTPMGYYGA